MADFLVRSLVVAIEIFTLMNVTILGRGYIPGPLPPLTSATTKCQRTTLGMPELGIYEKITTICV